MLSVTTVDLDEDDIVTIESTTAYQARCCRFVDLRQDPNLETEISGISSYFAMLEALVQMVYRPNIYFRRRLQRYGDKCVRPGCYEELGNSINLPEHS